MIRRDLPALKQLLEGVVAFDPKDTKYQARLFAEFDKNLLRGEVAARKLPQRKRRGAFEDALSQMKKFPNLDQDGWESKAYALFSEVIDYHLDEE